MSHSGWSTSNFISALGGTTVTAVPLTIHARYNPSSTAAIAYLVNISDGTTANQFSISVSATAKFQTGAAATGLTNTNSTASLATGTWYSLVGTFASATDRKGYIDGAVDGTGGTSRVPAGLNNTRIGIRTTGSPATGSLAEVAIWNVVLSAEDIAALVYTSPLLIRPDALVAYLPLLDSGTLDYMAPAATVTGTLTKDNDHPQVIYPRRRNKVARLKVAAAGGAADFSAANTLGDVIAASTFETVSNFDASNTLADLTASSTFDVASNFTAGVTLDDVTALATFDATGNVSEFASSITLDGVTSLAMYEVTGAPVVEDRRPSLADAAPARKKKRREYSPLEIAYIQRVMAEQAVVAAARAAEAEAEQQAPAAILVTPKERARRRELMDGIFDAMRREGEAEAARLKALSDLFALAQLQERAAVEEMSRIQGEIFAAEKIRRNQNALLALMMAE